MINPWPIVWADLKRSPGGVFAVAALIAVAVALGVTVSAQERALRQGSARAADAFDLLVGAPGSPTQLVLTTVYLQPAALGLIDGAWLTKIGADPGVAAVAPIAFGDFHRGLPVIGTTAAFATRQGRIALTQGRVFQHLYEVVAGSAAAADLVPGYRFRPSHGHAASVEDDDGDHDHEHPELTFTVVGRLAPTGTPWDRAILAPIEAVWWVHGLPTGHTGDDVNGPLDLIRLGPPWEGPALAGVPAIVIKPIGVGDAYRLRGILRSPQTMALFPAEVLVDLYAVLGDARTLVTAITIATQALVVAAVMLAVLAAMAGRRRQLAVLRALGASRGYLFATVWLHVTAMVSVGALAGLGLGWVGAWALSSAFAARTGVALPVGLAGPEFAMTGALIAIASGLATIPALVGYRQPVTTILRS